MDTEHIVQEITPNSKPVLLIRVLGCKAFTQCLLEELAARNSAKTAIVRKSHCGTLIGRQLVTFGLMSNFSFSYAHHMSTVEGSVVSKNDYGMYVTLCMLRSPRTVREPTSKDLKRSHKEMHVDLNPEFLFAYPAHTMRSAEINAVIGRPQLNQLDANNRVRTETVYLFIDSLDAAKYCTDIQREGS